MYSIYVIFNVQFFIGCDQIQAKPGCERVWEDKRILTALLSGCRLFSMRLCCLKMCLKLLNIVSTDTR